MTETSKYIKENLIILAGTVELAWEVANKAGLAKFLWLAEPISDITVWGQATGYNKDNTVIWLGKDAHTNEAYLQMLWLANQFDIPIAMTTTTDFLVLFSAPPSETVH